MLARRPVCVAISAAFMLLFVLEMRPAAIQLVAQRLDEIQAAGRDTPERSCSAVAAQARPKSSRGCCRRSARRSRSGAATPPPSACG